VAADHILGRPVALRCDGEASPRAVFTDPQVAAVGLTFVGPDVGDMLQAATVAIVGVAVAQSRVAQHGDVVLAHVGRPERELLCVGEHRLQPRRGLALVCGRPPPPAPASPLSRVSASPWWTSQ
jgi:hypothetical protein